MKCPECQRRFSFLYSFRILNPSKFVCPSCGTALTTGRYGKGTYIAGAIMGAATVIFAIYMEKRGHWTTLESITWFAIALPTFAIPYQWFCWRTCTFSRLTASAHVDVKQPTYLALTLAVFCWALFIAGLTWPYEPSRVYRFMGFMLGGMATVPTLALCGYYFYFRRVRTRGLIAASILSATYLLVALVLVGLVLAGSPLALKWL